MEIALITQLFTELSKSNHWGHYLLGVFVGIGILIIVFSVAARKAILSYKEIREAISDIKGSKTVEKDYNAFVQNEEVAMEQLRTLKHDLRADRVSVYQYHNGEHSIAHNPFLKVTMTHEVVNKGVQTIIGKDGTCKIPTSIYTHWNSLIFKGRLVCCTDIKTLEDDSVMRPAYQILSNLGIRATYWFPLKCINGKTTGFVAVDYLDAYDMEDIWKEFAEQEFAKIGILLGEVTVDN